MLEMQRAWYGDQFDEEQQSLREIWRAYFPYPRRSTPFQIRRGR
jgi:hypothetical protein